MSQLGFFKWSIAATVAGLVLAVIYGGIGALGVVAILIALEASISFDNAVVNATVLRRLSERWQRVFLTVGILVAVFGMRLVFPIAIVAVATKLGLLEVVDQAFTNKDAYASNVEKAAPIIGAFGGMFLLMVALSFLLDSEREINWLKPIEKPLAKAGSMRGLPAALAGTTLIVTSQLVADNAARDVLLAGLVGIVVYLVVRGAASVLGAARAASGGGGATGAAGFAGFLYLEMLDASFSLDGVLGAFAITTDIVVIALGLGVGAVYIRSLTVYLVRRRTLRQYRYLEHGAHWAIGALGVVLLFSIETHVPEWLTALLGLGFIAAAFASSVVYNRRHSEEGAGAEPGEKGQSSEERERDAEAAAS